MKMSYEEDDSDNYEVTSRQVLRDSEYLIRMSVENGDLLTVEVEDVATTNQWAGKFDIACKVPLWFCSISNHLGQSFSSLIG